MPKARLAVHSEETDKILKGMIEVLQGIHASQVSIQGTAARDGLDLQNIRRMMGSILGLLQDRETQQALRENRSPSPFAMKSSLPQPFPTMYPGKVEPLANPEKITHWVVAFGTIPGQRFLLSKELAKQVASYLSSRLWFKQVHPDSLQAEASALIQFASAVETSKET